MISDDLLNTNKIQYANEENGEIKQLKKFLSDTISPVKKRSKIKINNALRPTLFSNPTKKISRKINRKMDRKKMSLSSHIQPIYDKNITDLRYTKQIASYLNVDSRYRDITKYTNPSHYNISINKEYKYVESIELESVEFRTAPTPINSRNNTFKWTTTYYCDKSFNPSCVGESVDYSVTIPESFYTLTNFVQTIETTLNSVKHNLTDTSDELHNKFTSFTLLISPFDRSILFYQRAEKAKITEIKTAINTNEVVITIENEDGSNNLLHGNNGSDYSYDKLYPPIIISGLNLFSTSFGNIPVTHINNKVFYHTSNRPANTNYYEHTAPSDIKYNLYVYENEVESKASFTKTTTLSTSILPHTENGQPLGAYVGRVLETKVHSDTKTSTFGKFLGLATENEKKYIHTNIQDNIVKNKIAWKVTGTEQLSLATDDYIFMRIKSNSDIISNNMRCSIGSPPDVKMEANNLFFAKIIFSDKPPGDISIISVGGKIIFYDSPYVSLENLTIDYFDFTGKAIELYQEHSFTLKIVELREILKDSLLESRNGTISKTGIRLNC